MPAVFSANARNGELVILVGRALNRLSSGRPIGAASLASLKSSETVSSLLVNGGSVALNDRPRPIPFGLRLLAHGQGVCCGNIPPSTGVGPRERPPPPPTAAR